MNSWKNITIDDPAQWPTGHEIALDPPHADTRGAIQSIVNFPVKNVSIIFSRKGALRSNHYHKTDWHYMYVLSGAFEYYYRPTGNEQPPAKIVLRKGELVFTPPMEDHTTIFLEDTELLVMSRNPRDQESYESDVVRVEMIDPNQVRVQ